jgi:hypothetical protein
MATPAAAVDPSSKEFKMPVNVKLPLSGPHMDVITAITQQERLVRSTTGEARAGGAYRAVSPTAAPSPAASSLSTIETTWNPILEQLFASNVPARAALGPRPVIGPRTEGPEPASEKPEHVEPQLPSQLGPMTWNPITFGGFETHGQAQLTLFKSGAYEFQGSFTDPSAWDYDDSLVWGIRDANNTLYTFAHRGSMHGWLDRWFTSGASEVDSWNNTGNNPEIAAGWAALCEAWEWEAKAELSFDVGELLKALEKAFAVVGDVAKIVAVVAAL